MSEKANHSRAYPLIIIGLSLMILISLSIGTYYINYWPTDSGLAYIPSALTLFQGDYLSKMHEATRFSILPGKEALVLGIAIMQMLLNDNSSLFPNIFLLIVATMISAVLIFFILKKWLNAPIGFFASLLFLTTFWPYEYILLGAHQPLILMFFLSAAFFIGISRYKIIYFCSGLCIGFMLFSSPTYPLYFVYLIPIYFYQEFLLWKNEKNVKDILWRVSLMSMGFLVIYLLFTLPEPLAYIERFRTYVKANQEFNHFHMMEILSKTNVASPETMRGIGVKWVFKYFMLIMPVMFTAYLLSLIYLLIKSFKKPLFLVVILLSISTPISVEIVKATQIGRIYFSWLVGIIFIISLALYDVYCLEKNEKSVPNKKVVVGLLSLFFVGHTAFNAWIFFKDIYPSRMANHYVYNWLKERPFKNVFSYLKHPYKHNTVSEINNSKLSQKIFFYGINSIKEAPRGYILIPPMTGKSIWHDCVLEDFQDDPHLTQLLNSGKLSRYVIASFPTVSSSKVWLHEEEYCSYIDLYLGKITEQDRLKGAVWILDADKLQREWFRD